MTDLTAPSRLRRHLWKVAPVLIVMLIAGLAVAYMMSSTTKARRTKPVQQAPLVEVTTAAPGNPRLTIEAWGTVQAARRITLQSQVAGEVQRIGPALEPGAHAPQGELLLQIDPADYRLAVRQRQADLTKARADLALEEGRRAVAEQEFALLAKEIGASEAQRRLMLREPQRETARAAVASAEAALAAAQLDLKRTTVSAPFNALVLERLVNVGTRVANGANLATLVDTDTFWVELAVPAASLQWLAIPDNGEDGSPVAIHQERVWGAGQYREGRVIRLRGDLDEKGRMARLLVAVPDPLALADDSKPRLLLGAFVRAEIQGRQLEDVLVLERNWVRDGDTVWVMDGAGKLAVRRPQVVYSGANQVYLRGGLEPGDRIVTSELAVAVEGMPLRAAASGAESRP